MSDEEIKISAKEWREMQRQLQETNKLVASFAEQKAELERALNGNVLPQEDQPVYELAQPWYSPDDVYYLEGMIVVDVRGDIIPNEFMLPKNEAAQKRYDEYMNSLPLPGRQPTISEMIDATSKIMRDLGPMASGGEVQAAVLAALLAQGTNSQGKQIRHNEPPRTQLRPNSNVPLMSNTNITNNGTPMKPAAPERRGPQRSRAIGQAQEPTANVMGSVQSQPLTHLPA